MVCLFACFTSSKQQKLTHTQNATAAATTTTSKHIKLVELLQSDVDRESLSIDDESTKQHVTKEPFKDIQELKEEKIEEQLSLNEEKEVKFEFNVKSNEKGDNISFVEEKKEKEESGIKEETELVPVNVVTASTNHRYQNCESEDYEDVDLEGSNDKILVQEESSDLFSLSIDSRNHFGGCELGEKEVTSSISKCDSFKAEVKLVESNSNAGERSHNVESVLNIVENLTQWKSVKERTSMPLRDEDKENINAEQDLNIPVSAEPSFEFLTKNLNANADNKQPINREIGVDTSLSSWLVEPETTPVSNKSSNSVANSPFPKASSPRSHRDRPVLGVLTMEELKKLSTSNSPRRSRSQTPARTAVTGTVGSYWRHTGQATDSDSGSSSKGKPKIGSYKEEGKNVKWNCTPFQAKLERAVMTSSAIV